MTEQFTPYKQSLELKELGFDNPCIMCYYGISNFDEDKKERLYLHSGMGRVCNSHLNEKEHGITAPLWQQAFDWFRKECKLDSSYGTTCDDDENMHGYVICNFINRKRNHLSIDWEVGTYEEARLACLDKLIEIVKSNKK